MPLKRNNTNLDPFNQLNQNLNRLQKYNNSDDFDTNFKQDNSTSSTSSTNITNSIDNNTSNSQDESNSDPNSPNFD